MALYVTDTHPLVWYLGGQQRRLSSKSLQLFNAATNLQALIYVPIAVVWEVAVLLKVGRIRLRETFEEWTALLERRGYEFVAMDLEVLHEARHMTAIADPFDAVIVATAKVKDLPLITKDMAITEASVVGIVW